MTILAMILCITIYAHQHTYLYINHQKYWMFILAILIMKKKITNCAHNYIFKLI